MAEPNSIQESLPPLKPTQLKAQDKNTGEQFQTALRALQSNSQKPAGGGFLRPSSSAVLTVAVNGGAAVSDLSSASSTLRLGPNAGTIANPTTTSTGGTIANSTIPGSSSGAFDSVQNLANNGDSSAQMFMATRDLQEMNQQFNLQYLGLQEDMQAENRRYSALSNIMKTKHDTSKNCLNNLK